MAMCPQLAIQPGEWHRVMTQAWLTAGANWREDKAELGRHLVPVKGKVEANATCLKKCQDTLTHFLIPHSAWTVLGEPTLRKTRQGCIKV